MPHPTLSFAKIDDWLYQVYGLICDNYFTEKKSVSIGNKNRKMKNVEKRKIKGKTTSRPATVKAKIKQTVSIVNNDCMKSVLKLRIGDLICTEKTKEPFYYTYVKDFLLCLIKLVLDFIFYRNE